MYMSTIALLAEERINETVCQLLVVFCYDERYELIYKTQGKKKVLLKPFIFLAPWSIAVVNDLYICFLLLQQHCLIPCINFNILFTAWA